MNDKLLTWLLVIGCCAGQALAQDGGEEFRHWTTAGGKKSDARLAVVEQTVDGVKLKREDSGKILEVKLKDLSPTDRAYLRTLAKKLETTAKPPASSEVNVVKSGTWYQWRGPRRDGVSDETGLLNSWPAEGPPLAWRSKGLGRGMSSLVLGDDAIYTMGNADGGTQLVCVSLTDGSPLWKTEVGGGGDPNCTPTLDPESNMVYALSHGGSLLAADAKTGKMIWQKNFERDFGGKMMSGWGYSESPLVDGDRLIVTPGSEKAILAAMDKKTGELIWATPAPAGTLGNAGQDGAGYASVVISNGGGIKQYIQLVGRGIVSVAADDGRPLWSYNRIANGTANIPTPIVTGNLVFTSTGYGDGGTALLELAKQGRGVAMREVYYKPANELQNHHGGMVLVGNYVYMGHGHNKGFPTCIELKTGNSMWPKERGPGSDSAAIVCADGHLYFRYQDATMALIEVNPKEYKLKGSFRLATRNGESWPHPVVQGGKLYIRDQDELLVYDVAAK